MTAFVQKYSVQIVAILGIAATIVTQHYAGAWWLPIVTGADAVLGIHASTYIPPKSGIQ